MKSKSRVTKVVNRQRTFELPNWDSPGDPMLNGKPKKRVAYLRNHPSTQLLCCSSLLSSSFSPLSPSHNIGIAVRAAKTPKEPVIAPHPKRYSTNPPQRGPKKTPANWHILCNPNPCATAPLGPSIPGLLSSMVVSACCVSTYMAGAQAWMKIPVRNNKQTRRAICSVEFLPTNRRHMREGVRRTKQPKETKRPPNRSVMKPNSGSKKAGTAIGRKISPIPSAFQPNVASTKIGRVYVVSQLFILKFA